MSSHRNSSSPAADQGEFHHRQQPLTRAQIEQARLANRREEMRTRNKEVQRANEMALALMKVLDSEAREMWHERSAAGERTPPELVNSARAIEEMERLVASVSRTSLLETNGEASVPTNRKDEVLQDFGYTRPPSLPRNLRISTPLSFTTIPSDWDLYEQERNITGELATDFSTDTVLNSTPRPSDYLPAENTRIGPEAANASQLESFQNEIVESSEESLLPNAENDRRDGHYSTPSPNSNHPQEEPRPVSTASDTSNASSDITVFHTTMSSPLPNSESDASSNIFSRSPSDHGRSTPLLSHTFNSPVPSRYTFSPDPLAPTPPILGRIDTPTPCSPTPSPSPSPPPPIRRVRACANVRLVDCAFPGYCSNHYALPGTSVSRTWSLTEREYLAPKELGGHRVEIHDSSKARIVEEEIRLPSPGIAAEFLSGATYPDEGTPPRPRRYHGPPARANRQHRREVRDFSFPEPGEANNRVGPPAEIISPRPTRVGHLAKILDWEKMASEQEEEAINEQDVETESWGAGYIRGERRMRGWVVGGWTWADAAGELV
ncbi:hypothetical protein EDC01DRAFT_626555 [Geopyxis carbonaria]|nr:hypothetical protein EDC01DRAFT_626555 [Geopyxis carbonaria]